MTSKKSLHTILEKTAAQMVADFEASRVIEHRGSKGTVREGPVRSFLEDYMPRSTTVTGSGELMATTGEVSGQCDVMVLDADAPPLWAAEDFRIAPIECCHATIEVKSNLTRDELRKSWDAANAVKALPRKAYLPDSVTRASTDPMPPQVHVFAYSGISLEALGEELTDLAQRDRRLTQGIDSVCVLDQGFLTWLELDTSGVGARRWSSRIAAYQAPPGEVLLYLVATLHKHLAVATRGRKLDITGYMTEAYGEIYGVWPEFPPALMAAKLREEEPPQGEVD